MLDTKHIEMDSVRRVDYGVQDMLEPEAVTTIVRLGQSGWGAKRIAHTLGIARNTVRRYLKASGPVAYQRPKRASVLGGHEAWLRERFLQHRGNCDVVRQQLSQELGIETSLRTVERACQGLRQELEASRRATVRFETAPGGNRELAVKVPWLGGGCIRLAAEVHQRPLRGTSVQDNESKGLGTAMPSGRNM